MSAPEPWLRGPMEDVHPLVMPVFFSFSQVREDLAAHTAGLTYEDVWMPVGGSSIGFHLKHIAGSVGRITTYVFGGQLTGQELECLGNENVPDAGIGQLLAAVDESLRNAETKLHSLDPDTLYEVRKVGRRALPATVLGLLVHLAEHTQRHLGQAITLCKVVRQLG